MEKYIRESDAIQMVLNKPDMTEDEKLSIVRRLQAVSAADVVEVVRCWECIFWDTSWEPGVGIKGGAYYCPRCHLVTLKDSFCSGACRKDGGQDDG